MQLPSPDDLEQYIFRVPMASDDLNRIYEESQLEHPSTYTPSSSSHTLDALRGASMSLLYLFLIITHRMSHRQAMVSLECLTRLSSVPLILLPYLRQTHSQLHMFVEEKFNLRRHCPFYKPRQSIDLSYWPCQLGLVRFRRAGMDIGRSWSLLSRELVRWL